MSNTSIKALKIVTITAEDWQVVYFNDLIVDEGHVLDVNNVIASITDKVNSTIDGLFEKDEQFRGLVSIFYEIDQEYMEDLGEFPRTFEELDMRKLEEIKSVY